MGVGAVGAGGCRTDPPASSRGPQRNFVLASPLARFGLWDETRPLWVRSRRPQREAPPRRLPPRPPRISSLQQNHCHSLHLHRSSHSFEPSCVRPVLTPPFQVEDRESLLSLLVDCLPPPASCIAAAQHRCTQTEGAGKCPPSCSARSLNRELQQTQQTHPSIPPTPDTRSYPAFAFDSFHANGSFEPRIPTLAFFSPLSLKRRHETRFWKRSVGRRQSDAPLPPTDRPDQLRSRRSRRRE